MTLIVNPLLDVDDRCLDELANPDRMYAVARVVDEHAEAELHQFAGFVAEVMQAPSCVVNVVLDSTVLVVASHGIGGWFAKAGGMPAQWAPCSMVVQCKADVLITDTHRDPGHISNPVVLVSGVRSYAGVPLRTADGQIVATLCVLHSRPGAFTTMDLEKLAGLARQAQRLLFSAA